MEPPLPTLQPDTVSLPPSVVLESNDSSWPIGAQPALTCDFSALTNILPISMSDVLVDHVGGLVDLVGLCQGGWLSLVYAGRFPAKVRKLVMAGAPVDIAAQQSGLSAIAEATPLIMFESLVNFGDGLVRYRPQYRAVLGKRD
jgi:pimeloyl-ACP methyl ester carboxylesterase